MTINKARLFSPVEGFRALAQSDEQGKIYTAIVIGIIGHWVWEVLVAAVQSGVLDFGNGVVIVARILLAFIVGAVSFAGIFKQLANVDPDIRFWVALTQGFAVDALASPWAPET
jgi:hypothetical protein